MCCNSWRPGYEAGRSTYCSWVRSIRSLKNTLKKAGLPCRINAAQLLTYDNLFERRITRQERWDDSLSRKQWIICYEALYPERVGCPGKIHKPEAQVQGRKNTADYSHIENFQPHPTAHALPQKCSNEAAWGMYSSKNTAEYWYEQSQQDIQPKVEKN